MVVFGFGVLVLMENLEQMILLQTDVLQSQHLPEKRIGNRLLVEGNTQQQLRPMGLYGYGVLVVKEDLEQIIPQPEALRSQHLPGERIGNKFLLEMDTQQQSKPMGLYGLGDLILLDNLE